MPLLTTTSQLLRKLLTSRVVFTGAVALLAVVLAGTWVHAHYHADIIAATARATAGSTVINTGCGAIEVQESGRGRPLIVIHGSGGGHDQGMQWAQMLALTDVRVIAVSRFGYLRTPMPADASPEAQADAHVCVLDALGISRATVIGVSAGAPSAMQMAIRHPLRVAALILVVPIAHKPNDVVNSVPPVSDEKDAFLLRLLGSDFLYWAMLNIARDQVFQHVLATPPALIHATSSVEQARVNAIADNVLPVSLRAAGLASDTRLGKGLAHYALERIVAPTLVISAQDDGFGTYAAAQYTASRIAGAKWIGFAQGGHLLAGQHDRVKAAIADFVMQANRQHSVGDKP
jgi:2-hydroxy-6-oxonona-2,4-dienedioate hydrolase